MNMVRLTNTESFVLYISVFAFSLCGLFHKVFISSPSLFFVSHILFRLSKEHYGANTDFFYDSNCLQHIKILRLQTKILSVKLLFSLLYILKCRHIDKVMQHM